MRRQTVIVVVLLALLAVFPLITAVTGQPFLRDVANRVMILGLAAVSLNFILGYGGLVSFGHAAFIGLGGYAVGILASHGMTAGPIQLAAAVSISAVFAFVTGLLALKTRGVHFIMITMAFAQMAYYMLRALKAYGGDDGLPIRLRSDFGLFSLGNGLTLYYVSLFALVAGILLVHRLAGSRFGLVLVAARDNEKRVMASGFDPFRYQLVAYVLAGAMAGVAGFLLANFAGFISPAVGDWTRSAQLMFMVILGGAATLAGPLVGAAVYLALEEILSRQTTYWQFFFGAILLGYVLVVRGGLWADLASRFGAGGQAGRAA
jgi:branched-chain amino acid transport system permease protein